jgi:hypothetical protein
MSYALGQTSAALGQASRNQEQKKALLVGGVIIGGVALLGTYWYVRSRVIKSIREEHGPDEAFAWSLVI